ncbi:hypothetical protein KJ966_30480 [bacterium]|nr:hypothetical protein [bacterium]
MKKDIPNINEVAPDFSTLRENGYDFTLSQVLQAQKNVLLVFYRGHW